MTPIKWATLSFCLVAAISAGALADQIPYPAQGTYNSKPYSFTATSTGDITAYFYSTDATYETKIGLLVNGVSTGTLGLDNKTTSAGTSLDLGSAKAGDVLTILLQNITLSKNVYSDPTQNTGYDLSTDAVGHNHVYSTPYTATSPVVGSIPRGTFVGFEDEQFAGGNYNYNDEDFVLTNVTAVPEPAMGLIAAIGVLILCMWRPRKRVSALPA